MKKLSELKDSKVFQQNCSKWKLETLHPGFRHKNKKVYFQNIH